MHYMKIYSRINNKAVTNLRIKNSPRGFTYFTRKLKHTSK